MFLVLASLNLNSQEDTFYYFKNNSNSNFVVYYGITLSKLPNAVVEDEINISPMLYGGLKYDLNQFSAFFTFNSNYLSNNGNLSLAYQIISSDKYFVAAGFGTNVWFGHLELDNIKLKSLGWIYTPFVRFGLSLADTKLVLNFESQHSFMKTFSDDVLLGFFNYPFAGIAYSIIAENKLAGSKNLSLGLKMNYSKFYYQSWISYSKVDEFLYYPEVIIGFSF